MSLTIIPDFPLPFGDFDGQDPAVRLASFVVNWAVVIFFTFFCTFYLQRIVTKVLVKLICIYTWKRYAIHVDLQSFSIAPLRGRLFIKNFVMYTQDYSIQIALGYIQFSFWKSPSFLSNLDGDIEAIDTPVTFRADGFQLFIYNNIEAYKDLESIITGTERQSSIRVESKNQSQFWPVTFLGAKGSVIIGNQDLPEIMRLWYDEIKGVYCQVKQTDSVWDTQLRFALTPIRISINANVDFKETTLNYAARIRLKTQDKSMFDRFIALVRKDDDFEPSPINMTESFEWHGLDRYRGTTNQNITEKEEYAEVTDILFADIAEIRYGTTSAPLGQQSSLSIALDGGKINFGPWANRCRTDIQSFFFPSSYRHYSEANPASAKAFPVTITFNTNANLTIPTREFSEDAYQDNSQIPGQRGRPYGWLKADFEKESSLKMSFPMSSTLGNFETTFEAHLIGARVSSSVNYEIFLESDPLNVPTFLI